MPIKDEYYKEACILYDAFEETMRMLMPNKKFSELQWHEMVADWEKMMRRHFPSWEDKPDIGR